MGLIPIEFLDIPIIRSCNLSCNGCLTLSNYKNIKGHTKLEDALEWLTFWSSKIDPKRITIFGGEPLLHPQFIDWAVAIRDHWNNAELVVNTNGFYLPKLFDKVDLLFGPKVRLNVVTSVHHESFDEKITRNHTTLQKLIQDQYNKPDLINWRWQDVIVEHNKTWSKASFPTHELLFAVAKQYGIGWCQYIESNDLIRPHYSYDDKWAEANHSYCNVKNYVNLYEGIMYKCPPSAIIRHSIKTLPATGWDDYLEKYQPLHPNSSDDEIEEWFVRRKGPENICNMCAFAGPKNIPAGNPRNHASKEGWKIKT